MPNPELASPDSVGTVDNEAGALNGEPAGVEVNGPAGTANNESARTESGESANGLDAQRLHRQIGARVLSDIGFEAHEKEIVESSFNKARESGEKLPGKNNERRNYAYLSRLENLIAKHGNALEKKLWQASGSKLLVKPEDITEGYWKTQEQILRDNGQSRQLTAEDKEYLANAIREQQKNSLESWSNYLGDERSPYPLWFKIYAWDGMSKMGVFDKQKGYFKKRDKHTVAPYPKLNPAVLAKTYGAVADFYGFEDEGRRTENEARDGALEGLVKSGNFNKLYSKILLGEKAIPKTPERTEDVHGEWVEYALGDEDKLADAAEGTPWCIADPGTGRHYLKFGTYGTGDDEDYEDDDDYYDYDDEDNNWYGERSEGSEEDKAKFILFHLYDPETNALSDSACASIRLDTDGTVAEISGLEEGQALEGSLVPIVEEKVRTLPGGDRFLGAFHDKKELIRLDRKMQNGEDLSKEELEFIYEINCPIKTLDTYNNEDCRIPELREKYNIEYALEAGVDANQLATNLNPEDTLYHIDHLTAHGVDIDIDKLAHELLDQRNSFGGVYMQFGPILDTLLDHGADANLMVSEMDQDDIHDYLDKLIAHGANIDPEEYR